MAAPQHVRLAIDGNLAIIALDRPEARNAYSDEMCTQLVDALDAAEQHKDVRCAILTGTGQAFHAGGDIKAMKARSGIEVPGDRESQQ